MNKIKICSAMLTRCEFNNVSVRMSLLFWYLLLFVMSKTCYQYKERSTALASLNSPLVLYSLCVYQTQISGERLKSQWSFIVFFISLLNKMYHRIFGSIPSLNIFFSKKTTLLHFRAVFTSTQVFLKERKMSSHICYRKTDVVYCLLHSRL